MNRLLIGLAVLTVVAVFVSYCALIAGARADRRSDALKGGAAPLSGRTPLRTVGGWTAGTGKPRPARGCREAGARGCAGATHDASDRRPPDGPSAA